MSAVVAGTWRMVAYRGNYALYKDAGHWYVVNHATDTLVETREAQDDLPPPQMPHSNGIAAVSYALQWQAKPTVPSENDDPDSPSGVEIPGDESGPSPQNEHAG